MILYYDGVTTTVNTSGMLGTNLADIQTTLSDLMFIYNRNRNDTKPAIMDIKYCDKVPDIRICMSDGSAYRMPFYGIQAHELWNSAKNVIAYLENDMGKVEESDE